PPRTGRNLSAPSRLRILVDQPPKTATPPPPARAKGASAGFEKRGDPAVRTDPSLETEASKAAAKKKAAAKPHTAEEEHKLTKKDLLGMVEEVEITRPFGRRPKKAVQRIERKSTQV